MPGSLHKHNTTRDAELVEQTIDGDRGSFAALYDSYAPLVRAICYDATGDLHTAQDLAQDVFVRAYTKLHTLKDPQKFGAWVGGIARFSGKEWRRRQGRRRIHFHDELPTAVASTEETEDDRLGIMRIAMAELSESERVALHAFYLQEQSVEDARKIVELSTSGFYKLLDRAREKLGRLIQQKRDAR